MPANSTPSSARGLRLRSYFAALIVLFALSALVGVDYVRVQSRSDASDEALREANFAAHSAAKLIAGGVGVLDGALDGLAENPAAYRGLFAHPADCQLSYAPVGAFPAGHIDIVHQNGSLACSSSSQGSSRGRVYSDRSWLTAAVARPLALAPVADPFDGQPAALFSVPLPGLGVAAAVVELRAVGPDIAAELAAPRGLRWIVTTANGRTVLARSVDATRWVGASDAGTGFYRAGAASQRPDLSGKPTLFSHATVSGLGWRVYAGTERSLALAAASSLFDHELVIILAAVVVMLVAAAVIQRRIARPIAQLVAATRPDAVRAGESLPALRGPAEIRSLTASYNELVAAVGSELAERQRAQEAARAAEVEARATAEAYRVLFADNPQPMWIYDEQTLEIFEANEAAIESYGYSREEFTSMTIKDLRPAEDVPALLDSVAAARTSDRSGPWRHVKRDGSLIEVEIVSHVVDFRGRSGRLVMANDVTARERLGRQLAEVQRLESLGQLAGGVAHDFNNLLGVILNYAAFVDRSLAVVEREGDAGRWRPVRADLQEIEQAAQRAARLTHQLLAFARREPIQPEVVSLNDVVRETERLLRRTLGEHVELTIALADELRPVLADAGQLEQVLINLAVNARDAMPQGGRLLIETDDLEVDESYAAVHPGLEPGLYVRMRVSDTGQGMEPAVVEHAFEPFYTTKPKGEGTGLGLATIYGIVTQAGGQVRLYSEPGLGTTCSVMLPATDQAAAAPALRAPRDLEGHGELVLVVEDEHGIREVARRVLSERGYEVLCASDGPEAIRLVTEHRGALDLLITDVIMPRMMGKEVAERVRALRPAVRVLYMSGYAQPLVGESQGLPPGTLLVEKPFSERTLLSKVREALGVEGAVDAA